MNTEETKSWGCLSGLRCLADRGNSRRRRQWRGWCGATFLAPSPTPPRMLMLPARRVVAASLAKGCLVCRRSGREPGTRNSWDRRLYRSPTPTRRSRRDSIRFLSNCYCREVPSRIKCLLITARISSSPRGWSRKVNFDGIVLVLYVIFTNL